jgi:hypothetical protein
MYAVKEVLSYDEIYAAVGQIIENLNSRFGSKSTVEITSEEK